MKMKTLILISDTIRYCIFAAIAYVLSTLFGGATLHLMGYSDKYINGVIFWLGPIVFIGDIVVIVCVFLFMAWLITGFKD